MSVEISGKEKIYTHEKFIIKDLQGRICQIRASFDEDKFILRSAKLIKLDDNSFDVLGTVKIKDIILSNTATEIYRELPNAIPNETKEEA